MKTITKILEIGLPKSLIERDGEPTSELIDTDQLINELNMQMEEDRQLLRDMSDEADAYKDLAKKKENDGRYFGGFDV